MEARRRSCADLKEFHVNAKRVEHMTRIEKRECERFEIPGATIVYNSKKSISANRNLPMMSSLFTMSAMAGFGFYPRKS